MSEIEGAYNQKTQNSKKGSLIDSEKTNEIVKNWVEKYLPEEVLDEYALSYEKSKKSKEQKRQNKKYQKYLEKAHQELKPRLIELLEEKVEAEILNPEEVDQKVVLETIESTLNSDMHANTLLKAMKKYLDKNQTADQTEIKESSSKESETLQGDKEEVSTDKEREKQESSSIIEKEEKVEDQTDKEKKEFKPNKNHSEAPKTEKDFFEVYSPEKGVYLNIVDGSEFKILKYDPNKKEVYINKYQSFAYDQETESWGSAKEKSEEIILSYENFLDLIRDYVFDPEAGEKDVVEKSKQAQEENFIENSNEKRDLSNKEKAVVEIFNKYLEAKKQAIKKEVQKWHKSEEDGYMSTFTCNAVAYDLEVKFLKEDLPEKIENKFEEDQDKFEDVNLEKVLNYFQNLVRQKEQARENF